MKIVIEIPNFAWIEDIKDFKSAVKEYEMGSGFDHAIREALLLGKPLPDGHGDLKDEREVVNILLKYAHSEEGRRFANFLVSEIKDAPTIIEADKENEE
jgi:hypothetical protein